MKISFEWLKELSPIPWSADATAEKLAELGFPVEKIIKMGIQISKVISVKILSVSKHPNADRLQIALVTDGKKEHSIVCGAPNIASGQIVPLAMPGAKLGGGMEITISKIRGIESAGMLCSERELGLSPDHAGIMQLPQNSNLGIEVKEILGGQDIIFDIEVTPNRPDVLSHIGVARELAALSGKPLKRISIPWKKVSQGEPCSIDIKEPNLCFRYLGKLIHGVKVAPAPAWMTARLQACGIRSINNIVDITNYVLLELGHPLHAFDLAKLAGHEIIVRKAYPGEKMKALDEKTYELGTSDLVIADSKEPVAIAGIMGGLVSGVTESTTDILLESAVFDRTTVRQTSRRLDLKSESSLRFEKGTDAATAEEASLRAAQLISQLAGGTPGRSADAYPKKEIIKKIFLRMDRLEKVLGKNIPPKDASAVLKNLGFSPQMKGKKLDCTVPSHRKDIFEEVDLMEEVVRVTGYNMIPTSTPRVAAATVPKTYKVRDASTVIDALKGMGITETMTSAFSSPSSAKKFGFEENKFVVLSNPLSQEESILRPLVTVNLVKAAVRNLNLQRHSVSMFEIGKKFDGKNGVGRPNETRALSIIICGSVQDKAWQTPKKDVDFYFLKGIIEALNQQISLGLNLEFTLPKDFLHPNQSFRIIKQGQDIGWGGVIHPGLAMEMDISLPCVIAEFDLDAALLDLPQPKFSPLPKYPFVERDIAVIVNKESSWDSIKSEVEKSGGNILKHVVPFDIFSGGSINPSQKSVAFRVRLQSTENTLSDGEINSTIDKIKTSLKDHCGAQLR